MEQLIEFRKDILIMMMFFTLSVHRIVGQSVLILIFCFQLGKSNFSFSVVIFEHHSTNLHPASEDLLINYTMTILTVVWPELN